MKDLNLEDGRKRVVVEGVRPEIDGGRFPIKRVIGETVTVEADILADGHDQLASRILYRHDRELQWSEAPMRPLGNDRWRGEFKVSELGRYHYTVEGWVDRFRTWRGDLIKRLDAGQNVDVEMMIGAEIIEAAAQRAEGADAETLLRWAGLVRQEDREKQQTAALDKDLARLCFLYPDDSLATRYGIELTTCVDWEKARFSTWYELFPRSCSPEPGRYGTFADCEARLPYIASMGFDVLYLPPIHPIGKTFRKGKNNSVTPAPEDVGSPWAIGSEEGGHKSIHPELGTFEDFHRLIERAASLGIDVALDIAFQCAPEHPWVGEHPEWFRKRPDGTIQYAENPPKKYQDIYPIDFESEQWRGLWEELRSVVLFWIGHGVGIFRVDNPHTKAFPFWEWAINSIKARHPEVIFLAEAFTRPRVMGRLAKIGFSQSYTYFTWRNTGRELTDYFQELTQTEMREYFRANLWPNTPDILPEYLQVGGRPAFMVRLLLAATLGASYGIYGPAFELCANSPRVPGGEEYLDSEKYEIKHWNWNSDGSLKDLIARVNRIRRENQALQSDRGLCFHKTDNPLLICYSKTTGDFSDVILTVVNLDVYHKQIGWVTLDLEALAIQPGEAFQAHDLLAGGRYLWQGARNYVELTPESLPAQIFRLRRRIRTERDFDYYL